MNITALLLVSLVALAMGQRPGFAGIRPIGIPIVTTTADPLADRFGEVDGTTQRLPVEANGDRELVDRLSKLPIDKQPFWFINWQALEAHRQKPQTYPQKPNVFVDPVPTNGGSNTNFNSGSVSPNSANVNPSFGNVNPSSANVNPSNDNVSSNTVNGLTSLSPATGNQNTNSASAGQTTGPETSNRFGEEESTKDQDRNKVETHGKPVPPTNQHQDDKNKNPTVEVFRGLYVNY